MPCVASRRAEQPMSPERYHGTESPSGVERVEIPSAARHLVREVEHFEYRIPEIAYGSKLAHALFYVVGRIWLR